MYLVPELGQYLREHALAAVQVAIDDYSYVAPFWFVTKTENMYSEGIVNTLFDSIALFQARAMILEEPRKELLKYLDVPAFERGDLYYIQKLVATIEAVGTFDKDVLPHSGALGDSLTYTLQFLSNGAPVSIVDALPPGVSAPGDYVLQGTSNMPTYDSTHHQLMWSDSPPEGQEIVISYSVIITTGDPRFLVNSAEIDGLDIEANRANATAIANPRICFLSVVNKRNIRQ
jgi:hypothetical protein